MTRNWLRVVALCGVLAVAFGGMAGRTGAAEGDDAGAAYKLAEQPKDTKFLVEGHTDNSGEARQNKQLSAQRARAVADQLEQSGIDRDRIEVEDYGETRPIAGNDTPEGRASNRRVEIVIEPRVKTAQR